MLAIVLALVMLVFATPALAQAPLPVPALTLGLGTSTATGQTVVMTWSPSPTAGVTGYGIDGGMNSGANNFTATSAASPYTRVMPWPATAGSMWACVWPIVGGVNTRQSQRCSSLAIATGPTVPTTPQVIHVTANEPTTNADGTPLTDLKTMRVLWSITPGGLSGQQDFPASKPTGGGILNGNFTVPTNVGSLTGTVVAINMAGALSVPSSAVTFTLGTVPPTTFTLTTTTSGAGVGSVSPGGTYPSGQLVVLTETPAAGSVFTGWTGACSGTTPSCTVAMTGNLSATATFGITPPTTTTAPTVEARCQRRVKAKAPDTTGGWTGQVMNGTTKLGTAGASPLQRDVTLELGTHSITVVWTKTGVPARTSAVSTVTCP